MVWRLTFYDNDGVEIGYAEKPDRDTYNVVITHPDSGWEEFREWLGYKETLLPRLDEGSLGPPGVTVDSGPVIDKWEPEDHLREVQNRYSHPKVGSTELTDE